MKQITQIIATNYKNSISSSNVIDFWTVQICRRIASILVAILIKTPLSPNAVSWISFVISLFAGFFLLPNFYFVSAMLFWLSFVFDCADGQLAFEKKQVSNYGKYLDLLLDALKDVITYSIFLILLYETPYKWFAFLSLIAVSMSFVFDWVNRTLEEEVKPSKPNVENSLKLKYGIIFWSAPIRNFIIVISLVIGYPSIVSVYSSIIGGYLTTKKGYLTLSKIKN